MLHGPPRTPLPRRHEGARSVLGGSRPQHVLSWAATGRSTFCLGRQQAAARSVLGGSRPQHVPSRAAAGRSILFLPAARPLWQIARLRGNPRPSAGFEQTGTLRFIVTSPSAVGSGESSVASAEVSRSTASLARSAWALSPGLLASCASSSAENSGACSLVWARRAASSRSSRSAGALASSALRAAVRGKTAAYSRNERSVRTARVAAEGRRRHYLLPPAAVRCTSAARAEQQLQRAVTYSGFIHTQNRGKHVQDSPQFD